MRTLIYVLLLFVYASPAFALDYSEFARIPILHEGRIKPLESFARIHLRQFSGKENIAGLNASAWLAETLFSPDIASERPIFLVRSHELKSQLHLPADQKLFSFLELQKALRTTLPQIEKLQSQENLTPSQDELLQLHHNALSFVQLMRSFSLILPLDIAVPKRYQDFLEDKEHTYIQLSKIEARLLEDTQELVKQKGNNPDYYSEEEKKLADLSFRLDLFRRAGNNNVLLRVIPSSWSAENKEWFSPWQLIIEGQGSPENAAYLGLWTSMAKAFRETQNEAWDEITKSAYDHIKDKTSPGKLKLEILYQKLKPFHWALAFYGLCIGILTAAAFKPLPQSFPAAASLLGAGTLTHASGMITRIILLARPPVGTLYESVLFVSLICAVSALIITIKTKNYAALFAGAVAAAALLGIAPYLVQQGESLEMLVAVLNTNFWLSTHVICITIGYAVCVMAACLAHGYLYLRFTGNQKDLQQKLKDLIYKTSLVAILFTALGTALGGIWADQSWGRFWGWDPKENGALMIVLWLIWLQHGRISGNLDALTFAAGTAFLNIVVALAWFGVNLLNVGLHSYGFTNGLALSLSSFCALQTAIIGGLWMAIHYKERRTREA